MNTEIENVHIDQDWLKDAVLQSVLGLLNQDGEEARIAGGAVRNALLGQAISDIDIATTREPQDVMDVLSAEGLKVVPTGIDHGTVTVVADGKTFEVTTLRQDIKTDGRHAVVKFGRDWIADARRRDFTINALYADADGTVHDPLSGYNDLTNGDVRFIDSAETRIREDGLRMLRFFRFFAWYGTFRPDAEGLKACVRLKDRLSGLSAERVWQELSKLLAAPDPSRAILWMRQTGVLSAILPESEKWGIDALVPLIETEAELGWDPDALLRLMAIVPPREDRLDVMANRLKLPNRVRNRLSVWAANVEPDLKLKRPAFEQMLYRNDPAGIADRLRLAIVRERSQGNSKNAKKFAKRLSQALKFDKPKLPVKGQDLLDAGLQPGPEISKRLTALEENWIKSGFELTREELLEQL